MKTALSNLSRALCTSSSVKTAAPRSVPLLGSGLGLPGAADACSVRTWALPGTWLALSTNTCPPLSTNTCRRRQCGQVVFVDPQRKNLSEFCDELGALNLQVVAHQRRLVLLLAEADQPLKSELHAVSILHVTCGQD
jgi:hypothetical protein